MILVDTNILIYAGGSAHPLKAPCEAILRAVGGGTIDGAVTDAVLAEFVHARARRTSRPEAAKVAEGLLGFVEVRPATDAARRRALAIFGRSKRLSINDSLIAAVAIEESATLISADRDFGSVTGLAWAEPDAFASTL